MARISRKNQKNQNAQTIVQTSTEIFFNTAIYARLSVMDSGRSEGESIVNQRELLKSYIAEHSELTLKGVFIDNGKTGVNFDRPAWIDLIEECKQGNINCILIKDLSRLGRNYIETGDYLERILPTLGVRLIAVNDGYDGLNLSNNERLVSNLKNLVNDIYAKDISRKVIAAMQTKQKNGEFLGKFAAYGYLTDTTNTKKIVVNPDTAPVVRRIFEMKAEGLGNGTICQKLNDEGVPCPNRYRYIKGLTKSNKYENCIWIISTIAEILRNTLYLGHMTQGKFHVALCEGKEKKKCKRDEWIIVPNTHEAIVSQELFDSANAVFDKRAAKYKEHRYKYEQDNNKRSDLLLYDVAFCADCGKALARRKLAKGKNVNPIWSFGCKRHLDLHACSRKYILETELYEAVYYAIRTQVQQYVDVTKILEKLNLEDNYKSHLLRFDLEIEALEKELRRLSSLRQAVYEDYAAKLLTTLEYQFANEKYKKDITKQQNRLETALHDKMEYSTSTAQANKWIAAFSKFMDEKMLTIEMVQTLIERVEVSVLNHVTVTFKFRDEFESVVTSIIKSVIKSVVKSTDDTEESS